jgi:hypothetical protein
MAGLCHRNIQHNAGPGRLELWRIVRADLSGGAILQALSPVLVLLKAREALVGAASRGVATVPRTRGARRLTWGRRRGHRRGHRRGRWSTLAMDNTTPRSLELWEVGQTDLPGDALLKAHRPVRVLREAGKALVSATPRLVATVPRSRGACRRIHRSLRRSVRSRCWRVRGLALPALGAVWTEGRLDVLHELRRAVDNLVLDCRGVAGSPAPGREEPAAWLEDGGQLIAEGLELAEVAGPRSALVPPRTKRNTLLLAGEAGARLPAYVVRGVGKVVEAGNCNVEVRRVGITPGRSWWAATLLHYDRGPLWMQRLLILHQEAPAAAPHAPVVPVRAAAAIVGSQQR